MLAQISARNCLNFGILRYDCDAEDGRFVSAGHSKLGGTALMTGVFRHHRGGLPTASIIRSADDLKWAGHANRNQRSLEEALYARSIII